MLTLQRLDIQPHMFTPTSANVGALYTSMLFGAFCWSFICVCFGHTTTQPPVEKLGDDLIPYDCQTQHTHTRTWSLKTKHTKCNVAAAASSPRFLQNGKHNPKTTCDRTTTTNPSTTTIQLYSMRRSISVRAGTFVTLMWSPPFVVAVGRLYFFGQHKQVAFWFRVRTRICWVCMRRHHIHVCALG